MAVHPGSIYIIMQRTKGTYIHNNIQTVIFKGVLHKIFNLILKLTRSGNIKLIQSFPIPSKSVDLDKNKRNLKQNNLRASLSL